MPLAYPMQKFQDWFTQQWNILWGRRIVPEDVPWLMGPFGRPGEMTDGFFVQLAKEEGLTIERNKPSQGLISSIEKLNLPEDGLARLSPEVVRFYENTSDYHFTFAVKWRPFFKILGGLVNRLFSRRLEQLNIPTHNLEDPKEIESEIITLSDPGSKEVKYTIWSRAVKPTGQKIYSGVYSTCTLPSGQSCVKAVFPLPQHGRNTRRTFCTGSG